MAPIEGGSKHLPGALAPSTFGHKNLIFITKTDLNKNKARTT